MELTTTNRRRVLQNAAVNSDPHDLSRFVDAQRPVYDSALAEIRAGRKRSHWMWFVLPQVKGLGFSSSSEYFGIGSLAEARAFFDHPVLGARLVECTEALLAHEDRSATSIMGSPDDLKLRSSLTLFSLVEPQGSVFHRGLERFFEGQPDELTLDIVRKWDSTS